MRAFVLLSILLLGACSSVAPASVGSTRFRNDQTGGIVAACGPMQGFAGPLQRAKHGCNESYKGKGWTPVAETAIASAAE
jgi:hypothetical protein